MGPAPMDNLRSSARTGGFWWVLCSLLLASLARADDFSHAVHLTRASDCSSCHTVKGSNEVDFRRPTHSACKDCHKSHNFQSQDVSSGICQSCHGKVPTQIKTFPDRSRGLISMAPGGFTHAEHLDTDGAIAKKVGKITCGTCHTFDNSGRAQLPKHKECSLCHSQSNAASAAMPLVGLGSTTKDCLTCHDDAKKDKTVRPPPIGRWDGLTTYAIDVDFDHIRHQSSSNQACDGCHDGVQQSKNIQEEKRHLPTMYSCRSCHEDDSQVSTSYRIGNCVACHQTIRYGERPSSPYHYGSDDHKTGAKNERLYCAYCHDKNPQKFAPTPKYDNACASCHASEGVSPSLSKKKDRAPGDIGVLTQKNGASSSFASSVDLRVGRAFDPATDNIDRNDIDFHQVGSIDVKGYGLPNLSASFLGRFSLDPGLTTAFSQFENAYTLDQQPPADRGSVLSNGPIDRREDFGLFVYRGYAQLKDQPLFGKLSLDARAGRQSVFESAVPVFLDGGFAALHFGPKVSTDFFVGKHINFYTTDPADQLILGGGLSVAPAEWLEASAKIMNYLAPIATAEVKARATPYTWTSLAARFEADREFTVDASTSQADERLALASLEGGIDYFNQKSKTSLEINFLRRFEAGIFDYDYSNVTTQMGTFVPDGRQIFDYENLNLGTFPDFWRLQIRIRQPIQERITASFTFVHRELLEDPDVVLNEGFDQLNDADALAQLDQVLRAVALDNRVAYSMTYTELGPGIDTNDILVPGLRMSAKITFRTLDPLVANDLNAGIGQAGAFFPNVAAEGETSQFRLDLGLSQKLLEGKLRLSANLENQLFDYIGRYIELKNLDILSISTSALWKVNSKLSVQARYAFSNDMVLFDQRDTLLELESPNAPDFANGQDGDEVNTHDNIFTQRLMMTLMYHF